MGEIILAFRVGVIHWLAMCSWSPFLSFGVFSVSYSLESSEVQGRMKAIKERKVSQPQIKSLRTAESAGPPTTFHSLAAVIF